MLKKIEYVICPTQIIGLTAIQTIKKLLCNSVVVFVDPALKRFNRGYVGIRKVYQDQSNTLYVGEYSKDKNLTGLMFAFRISKEVLLLTGDHSNYQIWGNHPNNVSYSQDYKKLHVVVPHHGGNCGKLKPFDGKNGYAIVSTVHLMQRHYERSEQEDLLHQNPPDHRNRHCYRVSILLHCS